jgi:phosphoserine phosphatase
MVYKIGFCVIQWRVNKGYRMTHTLTTISSQENSCLTEALVSKVSEALHVSQTRWLYPSVACDFDLQNSPNTDEEINLVRSIIGDLPIDVVIQNSNNRKKKLFLADMDSTIIGQECIDELAAELGIKDKVAAITEAAMNGEIDFEGALKDRVALLAGLEEAVVAEVLSNRITINHGAHEALALMRAHGTHTALVSGGFTIFAKEIAGEVGFHEFHANELLIQNGKFSGKVAEPILGQQAKLDQLNRLANEKQISLSDTIAIGDGANDLPMLMNAGTGIAFHAKPSVAEQAKVVINHGDLSAILFVQGYTKANIDAAMV